MQPACRVSTRARTAKRARVAKRGAIRVELDVVLLKVAVIGLRPAVWRKCFRQGQLGKTQRRIDGPLRRRRLAGRQFQAVAHPQGGCIKQPQVERGAGPLESFFAGQVRQNKRVSAIGQRCLPELHAGRIITAQRLTRCSITTNGLNSTDKANTRQPRFAVLSADIHCTAKAGIRQGLCKGTSAGQPQQAPVMHLTFSNSSRGSTIPLGSAGSEAGLRQPGGPRPNSVSVVNCSQSVPTRWQASCTGGMQQSGLSQRAYIALQHPDLIEHASTDQRSPAAAPTAPLTSLKAAV